MHSFSFFDLWTQGFLFILILLTILWFISVALKNASIIDPFWGLGFVILLGYFIYIIPTLHARSILVMTLVAIWGLRLSIYLLWRNLGHGEDYRYQQFRKNYGPKRYWWISFFQVFLLQGFLMSIIALPLLGIATGSENETLGIWDILATTVWLIGFVFEAGGDFQLILFKRNKSNKGKVLDTGFWKYTRHPNYFGDAVVWWSFGIFALISGSYYTLVGPLIMNILLVKISGVSLLEKALKNTKPQYAAYIQRTSSFFPWFHKPQP